jgi:hypothetical protein
MIVRSIKTFVYVYCFYLAQGHVHIVVLLSAKIAKICLKTVDTHSLSLTIVFGHIFIVDFNDSVGSIADFKPGLSGLNSG